MLLVTGHGDGVACVFGADGVDIDHVERQLRRCFPTAYELTRTERALADRPTQSDDDDLDDASIAGLEVQGREDRAGDWKTRLRPLAEFDEYERDTWPLAVAVDALAEMSVPVVLHVVLGRYHY